MNLPENPDSPTLHAFVKDTFALDVPTQRLCPGHDAPWDYVWDSFAHDRDCVVWACRGGGKSFAAALATTLKAVFTPACEQVVLGGSQDQSDRVAEHIRHLLAHQDGLLADGSRQRRIRLFNDSVIHVLAQSETSVRGIHADRIRCDEVELFDHQVWRAVWFATTGRRTRRGALDVLSTAHVPGGIMERLIADCRAAETQRPELESQRPELGTRNSELGRNSEGFAGSGSGSPAAQLGSPGRRLYRWCLWEVIERCGPERICDDCPLLGDCRGRARRANGFFRIDDAIAIQARASRSSWETEMLCLGPKRDFLVFAEFDPARHVRAVEYCRDWPLYCGIDFGYADPFVCLWIQVSPDGMVHVLDEYVQTRLGVARHAVAVNDRSPGPIKMAYVDPAGHSKESTSGKGCTDFLRAAGIDCNWKPSAIVDGLEFIRAALDPAEGKPRLVISPRCKELIQAFRAYHFPVPGVSPQADVPIKDGPDHLIDALRYFFIHRMPPGIRARKGSY
jgi:hypothetical protein